jgi:general secretion pathway protein K
MMGVAAVGSRPGRQRGFALLIVLWAMVLLSLLFSRLVSAGRGEAEIAFNLRAAARLQAQADGMVERGIFDLLGSAVPLKGASTVHVLRLPGERVTIAITDLAGRINPNTASAPLLAALLHEVGAEATEAAAVSQAVVDWRSPDTQGQFEAPQYKQAGRDYSPAGAPFGSIAELGLVLGMTPGLLAKLTPHLSLYNRDEPNFQLADSVTRRALTAVGIAAQDTPDRPPRDVSVRSTVEAEDGTRASRVADVELQISSEPEGFRILTWQK